MKGAPKEKQVASSWLRGFQDTPHPGIRSKGVEETHQSAQRFENGVLQNTADNINTNYISEIKPVMILTAVSYSSENHSKNIFFYKITLKVKTPDYQSQY